MSFLISCSNCLQEIKDKISCEYEIPRCGLSQKKWTEDLISKIEDCTNAHKMYRLKHGPFKRFIEEVIPIAYFTEKFFNQNLITLRPGSQPFDAEIEINESKEYIEVVNSINGQMDNVLMKILNRFNFSPGSTNKDFKYYNNILKSGTKNVQQSILTGEVVYLEAELEKCMKQLFKQISNKINKNYSGTYHLLACFEFDYDLLSNDLRSKFENEFKSRFSTQATFKTITLYERKGKIFPFQLP